jgi:hypothetical protein
MIEQLFGSKTRVKLLYLFYSNPNRSFYVREITRKIDEQINSVRRELSNLLSIGIITSDSNDNKLYYEVNQKFEHYEPLLAMFGSTGAKPKLTAKTTKTTKTDESSSDELDLKTLGNIEIALLTGQFTRDESTGIDLLIVGNVNQNKLNKFVADLEVKEGKEIRYTVFSVDDYRYRDQIHDRFLDQVKSAKKQVLVDKHGMLS